jgi:hypothetical protein
MGSLLILKYLHVISIEFGTALTTILPILFQYCYKYCLDLFAQNKGNNKITELRTIFQRESQNS